MGKKLTQEEVSKRIVDTFLEKVTVIGNYTNRRNPIGIKCLECGYEWEPSAQTVLYCDIKKDGMHRCPNCKAKRAGKYVKCVYCGKEIFRSQKDIDKNISGFFYCSKECGNKHKNQLRKENGEWEKSKNYRLKALENYEHKCLCCGWNEDERILEVHHIDGNRNNNSVNNLCILCPTCHRKITLGYYNLDLDNKKLIEVKSK
jgi:hypothetical protein